MEINKIKEVSEKLNKFSPWYNDNGYITITEWSNGEGWTINIDDKSIFQLHMDELDAINYLTKVLQYGDS